MALNSAIEWTESTWNPVTGCTRISTGCLNCYAARMAKRLAGRYGYPRENPFSVTLHPDRLEQPLRWKGNHRIFVCSMSDLFHDDVPDRYVGKILDIIAACPRHTFQILTKRAQNLLRFSRKIGHWPDNAWVGVTVESADYRSRINLLRKVEADVRFISCEPLVGKVGKLDLHGIHWVIVGGESGPGARPMSPRWATSIRDQCIREDIPFFFKQWGGINKKAAGRCLEGLEWNQMPTRREKLLSLHHFRYCQKYSAIPATI